MKNITIILIAVFFGIFLSGCSAIMFWKSDEPPKLTMKIFAADDINPNIDNEPTPMTLQILQLSDNEKFVNTKFIDLYNDAETQLAKSLLSSKTVSGVTPDSKSESLMELHKDTKYVAVIAGFSKYNNENGKSLIFIKNKQDDMTLILSIKSDSLNLKLKED